MFYFQSSFPLITEAQGRDQAISGTSCLSQGNRVACAPRRVYLLGLFSFPFVMIVRVCT